MAVVARALVQNEFIVPVPLDLSPKSAKKQSTLVIVTVMDNPPDKQQLYKVYAYYGKENCQKKIGKFLCSFVRMLFSLDWHSTSLTKNQL